MTTAIETHFEELMIVQQQSSSNHGLQHGWLVYIHDIPNCVTNDVSLRQFGVFIHRLEDKDELVL